MCEENKKLKRKLIEQSFLPLFVLIFIKHFHAEIISDFIDLFKLLLKDDFSVLNTVFSHPNTYKFIILLISFLWIINGVFAFYQFKSVHFSGFVDAGETIKISEKLTETGINFLMTFILPLMIEDLSSFNEFIVYIMIIVLVISLMVKTNLFYQNPILILLGYHIYKIKFINPSRNEMRDKEFVVICKYKLEEQKIVKWKHISDNVLLMYNKN